MSSLNHLFEQFLRERTYVYNVTPKTRTWYHTAWHTFTTAGVVGPDATSITKPDLQRFVVCLRERGVKERRVPMSVEGRRVLYRYGQAKERANVTSDLMFPAREGNRWHQRNALRSYYCLLRRLGLPRSGFHRLRHTFATQYLRNGGEVVRLSIILGHSEVSTTMKYLHLLTEDVQRPHQSLSILNRLR